ncbi:MAG TPA: PBP1A family penicillin-binding protein [Gammaproteobacteria bacterium]
MNKTLRFFSLLAVFSLTGAVVMAGGFAGGYYYVAPTLPQAEELRDIRPEIPLAVYTRDGRLMALFGEKKRTPVRFDDVPAVLVQAILAAEDDRFFEHPGFDWQGYVRAGLNFLLSGGDRSQGGSTITMQVARTFFLNRDRTFVRKFKELILATRIEREFSKQEILELYLNTTFFGQNAYGVVAAAQVYFDKDLWELTVSDAAIIGGIPQGPSILNPYNNADAATQRRSYVLRRMRELDYIRDAEYRTALATPVESRRFGPQLELGAPHVAEMVRAELINRFGLAAYEAGLKVTTTIDSRLQREAQTALRNGLLSYDERHGYRGPLAELDPAALTPGADETQTQRWDALLSDYVELNGFENGLVVSVHTLESDQRAPLAVEDFAAEPSDEIDRDIHPPPRRDRAEVYFSAWGVIPIELESVEWAAKFITDDLVTPRPERVADVLEPGHVVRFRVLDDGRLRLAQLPQVQGALVSLDPMDGSVSSLVGGFDFFLSNYNRATQSQRQPGSSFKPFVYSAALENGFTAASIVNDAPIVEASLELEDVWRPENYSGRFSGPTRLREALINSLNLVSIRVIQQAGIDNTIGHLRRFGFDDTALPANATLALGAGGVAPLDLVSGYAVFANGGYRIEAYIIERIEDAEGDVLYEANPRFVCDLCEENAAQPKTDMLTLFASSPIDLYPKPRHAKRVISPQNAFLINDMMQDVVRRGTGVRAYRELGRQDLAGKTGTTNDRRDAWFAGFNGDMVTAAWVGFDQERSLGRYEQGAATALPIWVDFMDDALAGLPHHAMERPPGIVDVRINPDTGLVAASTAGSIFEKFRLDEVPDREDAPAERTSETFLGAGEANGEPVQDSLF